MGEDIKVGDLVMVVKPSLCCGKAGSVGKIFTVLEIDQFSASCARCRNVNIGLYALCSNDRVCDLSRLKKIDPPTEGDSLPTRKDLEVLA